MAKEEKNFGFPEKYNKKLKASTFKEDANTMSDDELKAALLASEQSIKEQEKLMDAHTQLQEAKELVKTLGGGFRDSMAYETAKIKYCLYMLETRGKL